MRAKAKGTCVLVGAGPGDLGLVTLRAREAVERAEVIVYDYLCNPDILHWAPAAAELIYAGKKSGQHTLSQAEINNLLVSKTKEGKYVVRLKGGDPFVFGRGGEEAEALADAGLNFEIVPGVSSAVAAPAYAGIPVTHRTLTSNFTVFTGHQEPEKQGNVVNYQALAAGRGTLVMLMGVERLSAVVGELLNQGADPALPVALIRWGTTARQQTIVSDLQNVVAAAKGFEPPAVVVFGEVVRMRDKLRWFEDRPLFGKRIVVTRTRKQASTLSQRLRVLGADVIELPTIRIEPPANLLEFGELVRDSYQYDWLIFTSVNGVDAFFDLFFKIYHDLREIGNVKIAAIGPATAARIRSFHLQVDVQPEEYVAESVVHALQKFESVENLRYLLVRAEESRDVLPKQLSSLGAIVDEAIAYRTVAETSQSSQMLDRFRADGADLITFTSSSTVTKYLNLNLPWPEGMRTASIGPITSATMRQHNLAVDAEAKVYDIEGLVTAIVRLMAP